MTCMKDEAAKTAIILHAVADRLREEARKWEMFSQSLVQGETMESTMSMLEAMSYADSRYASLRKDMWKVLNGEIPAPVIDLNVFIDVAAEQAEASLKTGRYQRVHVESQGR